jgi:hypothetical protein
VMMMAMTGGVAVAGTARGGVDGIVRGTARQGISDA